MDGRNLQGRRYQLVELVGGKVMRMYLQFGFGMMEHCRALFQKWGGGTVILSPRDLNPKQLIDFGNSLRKLPNIHTLIDPQLYLPHANHERLTSHPYWPSDYETGLFFQGPSLQKTLSELEITNKILDTCSFILPGLLATRVDDLWLESQKLILEAAVKRFGAGNLTQTIALSADVVLDEEQITAVLEESVKRPVKNYYLICESPSGAYFVDNPIWLVNVLDLIAGLRLGGAGVILGYCNQQMLVTEIAKVNALAAGTFANVRSFTPNKFQVDEQEDPKPRSVWYYCPQSLSEYTLPFMEVALKFGIFDSLMPPLELDSDYCGLLFSGTRPSSSGFNEQMSFRHYLGSLRKQSQILEGYKFDETLDKWKQILDVAETLLQALNAYKINCPPRDFQKALNAQRAAIELFGTIRGPILRRKWNSL